MVGVCEGSEGGSQPPHNHRVQLGSQCEQDPILDDIVEEEEEEEDPPVKRSRGPAKGVRLDARKKELGGPIPVEFDTKEHGHGTYKPVGVDSTIFISQVGTEMRSACNPGTNGWESVPDDEKAVLMARIDENFIINYRDKMINRGMKAMLQEMYRKWKGRCTTKYKARGNNPAAARQGPPPSCCPDADKWNAFVEFHSGEKQQAKSAKNSENRKTNTLPTCQGRQSFAQIRMDGVTDPSTEGPKVSATAAYKKAKTKRDGSWAHPILEQNHVVCTSSLQFRISRPTDRGSYFLNIVGLIAMMMDHYSNMYDKMREAFGSLKDWVIVSKWRKGSDLLAEFTSQVTSGQGTSPAVAAQPPLNASMPQTKTGKRATVAKPGASLPQATGAQGTTSGVGADPEALELRRNKRGSNKKE